MQTATSSSTTVSSSASRLTSPRAVSSADELTLHGLFEAQAQRTPHTVAVVHHNGHPLTYQQLNEQANQLAHYLISLGVKGEQLIAISLVRSPDMLVAFLGVLKAGAAYVPIDPDYPETRRQYILADAQVNITLTQSDLLATLSSDLGQIICLDTATLQLQSQPKTNPNVAIAPEQLAYVIYTSGSTGNPKGVMAHHRGLVNYSLALAEAIDLSAADRMLQFSTMSFDFIVSEVYPTLAVGGTLVLRSDEMVTSTQTFVDFIATQEVSVIQFTTAFWHELVSGIDRTRHYAACLPASGTVWWRKKPPLRFASSGSKKVGDYPRLFNAYGPTETTVITTLYDGGRRKFTMLSTICPIGRAIRNAQTYVLDEHLKAGQTR